MLHAPRAEFSRFVPRNYHNALALPAVFLCLSLAAPIKLLKWARQSTTCIWFGTPQFHSEPGPIGSTAASLHGPMQVVTGSTECVESVQLGNTIRVKPLNFFNFTKC